MYGGGAIHGDMADDPLRHPRIDERAEPDLDDMSAEEKYHRPALSVRSSDCLNQLAKIARGEYVWEAGEKCRE
jgi:hypothetical protein